MTIISINSRSFRRQPGLTTVLPCGEYSAAYDFDESRTPAISLDDILDSVVDLKNMTTNEASLIGGFESASRALFTQKLLGIRMKVIILMEGSMSMVKYYTRPAKHQPSLIEALLMRTLGFALAVDGSGRIPVYRYGSCVSQKVNLTLNNYKEFGDHLTPDLGHNCMEEAFSQALNDAYVTRQLVMIVNIVNSGPYGRNQCEVLAKNEFIRSSKYPVMINNLALQPVPFLTEVGNMPAKYDITRSSDGNLCKETDGRLNIAVDNSAIRLTNNVNYEVIDPHSINDTELAQVLTSKIVIHREIMARVGLLSGVPGFTQEFETLTK